MDMVGNTDDQKHLSWCCFLKPPLMLLVVTLIPSTAFFFYFLSSHGVVSILITITVMFISSIVLFHKLSKNKTRVVCLAEEYVREESPGLRVQDDASATAESQTRPCDAQEGEMTDLPSDTETSSGTVASEAFELDWVTSSRMVCDVSSSCFADDHRDDDDDDDDDDEDDDDDDDDDDEEEEEDGLIEIALMDDGLCDEPKEKKKYNLQKLWDGDGEGEINDVNVEEENLIEIDLSIGSIKRPTVEI